MRKVVNTPRNPPFVSCKSRTSVTVPTMIKSESCRNPSGDNITKFRAKPQSAKAVRAVRAATLATVFAFMARGATGSGAGGPGYFFTGGGVGLST